MDRLVSAYRNKLECRAGKEYYYRVIKSSEKIFLQGNKKLGKRNTILFTAAKFWQEHGQKAVQSYRRAGKLRFGEER